MYPSRNNTRLCRLVWGVFVFLLSKLGCTNTFARIFHFVDVNVINSMIENGADINHLTDDSGNTSLHMAVQNARVPVVKLLIKAGSLVNATNKDLNAPLHVIGEVEKTVAKLLKNGENVNADNYEDDLHSIAEILIDNGANVNAKNANGKTPLDLVTNEKSKAKCELHSVSICFV